MDKDLAISVPGSEIGLDAVTRIRPAGPEILPSDEDTAELEKQVQRAREQQQEQLRAVVKQLSPRPRVSVSPNPHSPQTTRIAEEYRLLRRQSTNSARSQVSFGSPFSPRTPMSPGFSIENGDFALHVQCMHIWFLWFALLISC